MTLEQENNEVEDAFIALIMTAGKDVKDFIEEVLYRAVCMDMGKGESIMFDFPKIQETTKRLLSKLEIARKSLGHDSSEHFDICPIHLSNEFWVWELDKNHWPYIQVASGHARFKDFYHLEKGWVSITPPYPPSVNWVVRLHSQIKESE